MRLDVRMVANEFVQQYPQDLEITVEGGQVSINQELPYHIAIPEKIGHYAEIETEPTNVVTFTTDEDFGGVHNFYRYESFAVVTQSAVYFMSDDDTREVRAYPIPETQEKIEVSAALMDDLKEQFLNFPFIKERLYVPTLVALGFIISLPLMIFVRLLVLVFYAFVVYLIAKFFMSNKNFSYGKLYQLSMHSVTPVIIVSWLVGYVGKFSVHSWLHLGLFVVWTLYVLSQLSGKAKKTTRAASKRKATKRKKSK